MTLKHQKIISLILILIASLGGFEVLIYIANLNQPTIFLKSAFMIWLYLALKITLLYDLHFKNPGALKRATLRHESLGHWLHRGVKIFFSAIKERLGHLWKTHHFANLFLFLILPGSIFWSTVGLLHIQTGSFLHQQILSIISSFFIVLIYWYMKESFLRKSEIFDRDIFAGLSASKLFAICVSYAFGLAIARRFCLGANFFAIYTFALTNLLIFQALYQHKKNTKENILWTQLISIILGVLSYFVYKYWGYNFYTAALFMGSIYNFFWGVFHYKLDKILTKKLFFEIFIISLTVILMLISVTNFKAKLLDGCMF